MYSPGPIVSQFGRSLVSKNDFKFYVRAATAIVAVWVTVQVLENLARYTIVSSTLFMYRSSVSDQSPQELRSELREALDFASEWLGEQDVFVEYDEESEFFHVDAPFTWKLDLYFWEFFIEDWLSTSIATLREFR